MRGGTAHRRRDPSMDRALALKTAATRLGARPPA